MKTLKPVQQKRKHHYVPVAYLNNFCDETGRLRLYRKDKADLPPVHAAPKTVAFKEYFYSQPLEGGGQDNNALEEFFLIYEGKWAELVRRLKRKENINEPIESLESLYEFIALQRARVPAFRDGAEAVQAAVIKDQLRRAGEAGLLPSPPPELAGLLDYTMLNVIVDPHESILAMPAALNGVATLFDKIGLLVLENFTGVPFLTSDNPVTWYDPSTPENSRRPYSINPGGPIELFFPVTPNLGIYGHSELQEDFAKDGLTYAKLTDRSDVEMFNRTVCRFGYRAVFAQAAGQEEMIRRYSPLSPIIKTSVLKHKKQSVIVSETVFGRRPA